MTSIILQTGVTMAITMLIFSLVKGGVAGCTSKWPFMSPSM